MIDSSSSQQAQNAQAYEHDETVARYREAKGDVSTAEQMLFDTWIEPGARILDLGVGAGRTTAALAGIAGDTGHYVGIDYSAKMVEVARADYPDHDFAEADAADLSAFDDASFDAVVFSFNGLDCLHPDRKRHDCLAEIHRVLAPGGIAILSTHNAQRMVVAPRHWTGESAKRKAKRLALAARDTARRLPTAIREGRPFRHSMYYRDLTHGESWYHAAGPATFTREVSSFGFEPVSPIIAFDHPRGFHRLATSWYYVAFRKGRGTGS